jgi:uncharacterized protein YhbP (UPF0306 family)
MNICLLTDIHCIDISGSTLATQLTEEKVRHSAFSVLNKNTVCSMATVTPEARAHIHSAYFSYSLEYELFFLSNPNSVHCQNLKSNASMAVTVFPATPTWGEPSVGIQLFGSATEASGAAAETAERSYGIRFPGFVNWKAEVGKTEMIHQYELYRFQADSFKILDEGTFGDSVWVRASILRRN